MDDYPAGLAGALKWKLADDIAKGMAEMMSMTAVNLCSTQRPWVDTQQFVDWVKQCGCEIETGPNDNRYDGEVHYIIRLDDETYDMSSNRWDYRLPGWQLAIDWIKTRLMAEDE